MWIKEQSDRHLPELDTSNVGLIIERMNFEQIEIQTETGTRTEWQCDTRHIAIDEFYREKQDANEIMTGQILDALAMAMGVTF